MNTNRAALNRTQPATRRAMNIVQRVFRDHVLKRDLLKLDICARSNIQRGMGRVRFEIAKAEALRLHKADNGGMAATILRQPGQCI